MYIKTFHINWRIWYLDSFDIDIVHLHTNVCELFIKGLFNLKTKIKILPHGGFLVTLMNNT